jgi:hypothetical protein
MDTILPPLLRSEQNPEECDARDDDRITSAGHIKNYLLFIPRNAGEFGLIFAVYRAIFVSPE